MSPKHSRRKYNREKAATRQRAKKQEGPSLKPAEVETMPAVLFRKVQLDPANLSPGELLQLQGEIGNRAAGELVGGQIQRLTLSMLQRQDEDEAGPLTRTQVAKALWYYRERRAQYTPDIIRQIQAGVGSTETGVADEEMVQAVAVYQQANSPLKVDGMAGPRTLPALFPTGLAEEAAIAAYTEAAREVIDNDWEDLDQEGRADAILEKVNERLTAAGVPEVGKVIQALDANEYGRFAFSLWSIRINEDLLDSPTLTEAQAADLADTMYHEARHGEQWYRMAQLLAGQGRTAAQIAAQMGIPPNIAALAHDDPLQPGSMQALIADGWFQSVYGTGRAHRRRVLGPTGTYEQYRNLPEESDAWRVGTSVKDAYLAGPATEEETE